MQGKKAVRGSPPSVSCQTMPSSVTAVPGSHGPRHSGSVMVDALHVPTQASVRADDATDVTGAQATSAASGAGGEPAWCAAPFTATTATAVRLLAPPIA